MEDIVNTLENIVVYVAHLCCTAVSFGITHWNGIGGAILMVLQGAYLIKKLREKKECK